MTINVTLTLDVEPDTWAEYFGIPESNAPAHMAETVRQAVADGSVADALKASFPALRDTDARIGATDVK